MNFKKNVCLTIVAMAFVVAVAAAAKVKDSRDVLLRFDATIAGSQLRSGVYNVQYQTHSPEATVSFLRGNKVVATAEGKVVDRGSKYSTNEVVFAGADGGARTIQEIRFGGSSQVIVFNE